MSPTCTKLTSMAMGFISVISWLVTMAFSWLPDLQLAKRTRPKNVEFQWRLPPQAKAGVCLMLQTQIVDWYCHLCIKCCGKYTLESEKIKLKQSISFWKEVQKISDQFSNGGQGVSLGLFRSPCKQAIYKRKSYTLGLSVGNTGSVRVCGVVIN